MDISNVGGFAAAGKFPVKASDNDGDDKGGVKAGGGGVEAQGVSAGETQKGGGTPPAAPVAKTSQEDNVVQTKTQGSDKGRVDVLA